MSNLISPALNAEALYSKSKVFISKGLKAKENNDLEEYQLWASLALELLAKSSLSKIHPALVADPSHYQSLFAACGHQFSSDIKTITAKTLFPRLVHLSKKFDLKVQNFCLQMSLRRNSEIHSGESPFSGMKSEAWETTYWYAIEVILGIQQKSLEHWLGARDSKTPRIILKAASEALEMAVNTRILHARENFLDAHKNEKEKAKFIKENECKNANAKWDDFDISIDHFVLNECPSCGAKGILGGIFWSEEVSDETCDDPFIEYVEKTYSSEEFQCKVCDLHLLGTKEILAASLPEDIFKTEERAREYEPDYGND